MCEDVYTRSIWQKRRSIRAEGGVLNLDAKGLICDLWFVFYDTRWFVTFAQLRRVDNATWLSRRAIVLILLIQQHGRIFRWGWELLCTRVHSDQKRTTQLHKITAFYYITCTSLTTIFFICYCLKVHNFYHFAGSSTNLLLHHVFHFIQLNCWQGILTSTTVHHHKISGLPHSRVSHHSS